MIVVTGAAGFIGSCLAAELNRNGMSDLILADDFSSAEKNKNLIAVKYVEKIDRDLFLEWFAQNASKISFVYHIGARTDTTEFDRKIFDRLNVNYTKSVWNCCAQNNIPLVYASSAATYGLGEYGYNDDHNTVEQLKPLNSYGDSKNEVDKWVLHQEKTPPFWAGLKFFNVYGPNEYHKGRMASVIFHAYHQIKINGKVKLFKSHRSDFKDGEQLRDFIYVKDVVKVCLFLKSNALKSGLYNLGTGKADSFNNLVTAVFEALDMPVNIEYIDTPVDIRDKYQYFTEANMNKLLSCGYHHKFTALSEGVKDYVNNFLEKKAYY